MVDIIKWHIDNGGHAERGVAPHALRLLNETVELCIASGAAYDDIIRAVTDECIKAYKNDDWGGNIKDIPQEFADVSFLLDAFKHYAKIDVEQARSDKFKILLKRDFKPDENGVLWRAK